MTHAQENPFFPFFIGPPLNTTDQKCLFTCSFLYIVQRKRGNYIVLNLSLSVAQNHKY